MQSDPNAPAGRFLKRIDIQGRTQDDFVEIAVGETLRIGGIAEMLVGFERAFEIGQDQPAEIAFVDAWGQCWSPVVSTRKSRNVTFCLAFGLPHRAFEVGIEETEVLLSGRSSHGCGPPE